MMGLLMPTRLGHWALGHVWRRCSEAARAIIAAIQAASTMVGWVAGIDYQGGGISINRLSLCTIQLGTIYTAPTPGTGNPIQ